MAQAPGGSYKAGKGIPAVKPASGNPDSNMRQKTVKPITANVHNPGIAPALMVGKFRGSSKGLKGVGPAKVVRK